MVAKRARADYDALFESLNKAISGSPYFLASGFSALVYFLAMLTEWHPDKVVLFSSRSNVAKLYNGVARSTPYKAAMETHAVRTD